MSGGIERIGLAVRLRDGSWSDSEGWNVPWPSRMNRVDAEIAVEGWADEGAEIVEIHASPEGTIESLEAENRELRGLADKIQPTLEKLDAAYADRDALEQNVQSLEAERDELRATVERLETELAYRDRQDATVERAKAIVEGYVGSPCFSALLGEYDEDRGCGCPTCGHRAAFRALSPKEEA